MGSSSLPRIRQMVVASSCFPDFTPCTRVLGEEAGVFTSAFFCAQEAFPPYRVVGGRFFMIAALGSDSRHLPLRNVWRRLFLRDVFSWPDPGADGSPTAVNLLKFDAFRFPPFPPLTSNSGFCRRPDEKTKSSDLEFRRARASSRSGNVAGSRLSGVARGQGTVVFDPLPGGDATATLGEWRRHARKARMIKR